jgi:tetratricopeptide (TPR) repeat protein
VNTEKKVLELVASRARRRWRLANARVCTGGVKQASQRKDVSRVAFHGLTHYRKGGAPYGLPGPIPSSAERMTSRRHSLLPAPPPLSWQEQAATLDGAGELLPPVFWSALRSVQLWMETRPESRAALFTKCSPASRERFAAATAAEPGIAGALRVFVSVLDAPARAGEDEIATACDEVRAWAEERGQMRLAALFAEWAAYADPESAARANHAGRLCRRTSQVHRAEVWYDRALKLGIRSREPDQQLRAQLGYGNLLATMGRLEDARDILVRAVRRARRHNRKKVAAEAHHDLLVLEAEAGNFHHVEQHFGNALTYYPNKHPRLPVLVHDWGGVLLRQGHYSAAVQVLEAATAVIYRDRHVEALHLSTLAFAYSAAGCSERFAAVHEAALEMVRKHGEFRPAVLENLAQGWRGRRDWIQADSFAERAFQAAVDLGHKLVENTSRRLLVEIAERSPLPPEAVIRDHFAFEQLVTRCQRKLRWLTAAGGASRRSRSERELL